MLPSTSEMRVVSRKAYMIKRWKLMKRIYASGYSLFKVKQSWLFVLCTGVKTVPGRTLSGLLFVAGVLSGHWPPGVKLW